MYLPVAVALPANRANRANYPGEIDLVVAEGKIIFPDAREGVTVWKLDGKSPAFLEGAVACKQRAPSVFVSAPVRKAM